MTSSTGGSIKAHRVVVLANREEDIAQFRAHLFALRTRIPVSVQAELVLAERFFEESRVCTTFVSYRTRFSSRRAYETWFTHAIPSAQALHADLLVVCDACPCFADALVITHDAEQFHEIATLRQFRRFQSAMYAALTRRGLEFLRTLDAALFEGVRVLHRLNVREKNNK